MNSLSAVDWVRVLFVSFWAAVLVLIVCAVAPGQTPGDKTVRDEGDSTPLTGNAQDYVLESGISHAYGDDWYTSEYPTAARKYEFIVPNGRYKVLYATNQPDGPDLSSSQMRYVALTGHPSPDQSLFLIQGDWSLFPTSGSGTWHNDKCFQEVGIVHNAIGLIEITSSRHESSAGDPRFDAWGVEYLGPLQPYFGQVNPNPAYPGQAVTVTGVGLSGITSLSIDGTNVPNFEIVSDTEITFIVPEMDPVQGATLVGDSPDGQASIEFSVIEDPAGGMAWATWDATLLPGPWWYYGGPGINIGSHQGEPWQPFEHPDGPAGGVDWQGMHDQLVGARLIQFDISGSGWYRLWIQWRAKHSHRLDQNLEGVFFQGDAEIWVGRNGYIGYKCLLTTSIGGNGGQHVYLPKAILECLVNTPGIPMSIPASVEDETETWFDEGDLEHQPAKYAKLQAVLAKLVASYDEKQSWLEVSRSADQTFDPLSGGGGGGGEPIEVAWPDATFQAPSAWSGQGQEVAPPEYVPGSSIWDRLFGWNLDDLHGDENSEWVQRSIRIELPGFFGQQPGTYVWDSEEWLADDENALAVVLVRCRSFFRGSLSFCVALCAGIFVMRRLCK